MDNNETNRFKALRNKYSHHAELFQRVWDSDPSKSKYCVEWMMDQIAKKNHRVDDVIPTVDLYWKVKDRLPEDKRELYSFEKSSDLENLLKEMEPSKRSERRIAKENGAIVLHKDDNFTLVQLVDKASAVFYGKGTKWCISMESGDYFNSYTKDDKARLYVAINHSKNSSKHAILIEYAISEAFNAPYAKATVYNSSDEVIWENSRPPKDYLEMINLCFANAVSGWAEKAQKFKDEAAAKEKAEKEEKTAKK
jgi:hypothetical protein